MIDYTAIVVALVGGLFSVLGVVIPLIISSRIKDKQAAETLNNAVGNALGAMKNAVDHGLMAHPLQAALPSGTSPELAAGVQYALDHAGAEAARIGITPDAIADKINARLGLVKLEAAVSPTLSATGTQP